MHSTRIVKPVLFYIFFIILIACSPVGKMATDKDMRIKELTPHENKALIYILRPPHFGNPIMHVYINDKYLGTTASGRYLYAVLDPGNYKIESDAENTSEIYIKLTAGRTYFILQENKMGVFYPRCELMRITEKEGRQKLTDCSLSSEIQENW